MVLTIYPDELVQIVSDKIASNKGKITLNQLWDISAKYFDLSDKKVKQFVLSCVILKKDIEVYCDGAITTKNVTDIIGDANHSYSVGITEDSLWTLLTGYTKKESTIGNSAFELLLEVAKSGEKGINTMDLAQVTGQDPRSVTGRIKKINHLLTSSQLIYKGHVVKQLKLKKFSHDGVDSNPYINIRDHLATIVEVVKRSKNGIRQIIDLKRELKFDKEKRLSKAFIAAIAWLDEKEYLKKVLVVSPKNPAIKIRCVKYVKDIPDSKGSPSFEYDSNSADEDSVSDSKAAFEDEDLVEGLDNFNATDLLQNQGLVMEEKEDAVKNEVLLNRFYPLQNQTYDIADKSGLKGISTMDVVNRITGKEFQRAFTKSSEYYLESVDKQKENTGGYRLFRIYDFEGKKKFFRLFTAQNFQKLTNAEDEISVPKGFDELDKSHTDLKTLNEDNFVALNNTVRFTTDSDGQDIFFWHGELKIPPNSKKTPNKNKRKRQVKNSTNASVAGNISNPKRIKLEQHVSTAQEPKSAEDSPSSNGGTVVKGKVVNFGGFSARSLRSLQRQRAILKVMNTIGGVAYLREQFYESVSKYMGSTTTLDKKTVRGDVDLMVESEKLGARTEPVSGRKIIFLPTVGEDAIQRYILKEKDSKKATFTDVIHDTEIYFFDQTEKNRFHRGKKSVERIRKFQNRQKNAKIKASDDAISKKSTSVNVSDGKIKRRDKKVSAGRTTVVVENTKEDKTVYHAGTKDGVQALIRAVVVTKSIKNEIMWDKITKLFPNNSLDNLKKKWTARRVRMGHSGWRAYVDKWKKMLVLAIKSEKISLRDVEELDLIKLLDIWTSFDEKEIKRPLFLYKNYEENRKKFTLVRDDTLTHSGNDLAMSSMIQREISSLKKTYTRKISASTKDLSKSQSDDYIRTVIRSILIESPSTTRNEIEALKNVGNESIDNVIMDMAKEKQIYLHGSKLECTDTLPDILENRGNYKDFGVAFQYRCKVNELLEAGNAIVINQEPSDISSWVLIDLISGELLNMDVIPMVRNVRPLTYTSRRFEIRTLTPPLIIYANSQTKLNTARKSAVKVPLGKPFSRLWVNGSGSIRPNIWKQVVTMVVNEIIFHPGITLSRLQSRCREVLSLHEISEICKWLLERQVLITTDFDGYWVNHNWYSIYEST
ncbi:AAC_collapsed_G0000670.mRNA.1.CDS.1 [Saccharomyces cerevisiae]|nr:AAC_collapsed_G0000670.mRNA.1.CDS.1 [Saccharomyces cerevisiae]